MRQSVDNKSVLEQEGTEVCVELSGSLNSCQKSQIKVAHALGLFRRGDKRKHTVNPCLKGQVKKIEHLLDVTKAEK